MARFTVSPELASHDIPLRELQAEEEFQGKRLIVGVAFAKLSSTSQSSKLLLLQRAADEDAYPNMYELPGGHAEEEDATILDTVARELLEETGLVASHIVCEFDGGFEYTSGKCISKQLNFLVNVADTDPKVTLNPNEHQAYTWVEAGDSMDDFPMTEAMKESVCYALGAISG